MDKQIQEELRNLRNAVRYLARVIDKINGSQYTPDNHYDEVENILDHE